MAPTRGGQNAAAAAAAAGALWALNAQVDARVVQLLLELEELEGKRAALNVRVEEGWFSLSRARYAMGAKAVSPLQYGSSMASLFRVCTSEPKPSRPEFQVISTTPGAQKDLTPKEAQGVIDYGDPESESLLSPALWRRPQPQGSPLQSIPLAPPLVVSPERDPLTWFGILVPQSLRQAQGSFRAALLMVGEIAELQSRMEWGRAQIQALHREKQTLLDQLKAA